MPHIDWSQVRKLSGLFLIFATFIAKDILRDHWKELSDAAGSVESTVIVLTEINGLYVALNTLSVDTDKIMRAVEKQTGIRDIDPTVTPSRNSLLFAEQIGDNNRSSARLTKYLLKRLGQEQGKLYKDVESLMQDIDRQYDERIQLRGAADRFWAQHPTPDYLLPPILLRKIDVLTDNSLRVSQQIGKLRDDALEELKTRQEKAERYFSVFTIISYFLYVIGWGLTFYGAASGEVSRGVSAE